MTFLLVLGVAFLVAYFLPRSWSGRSASTAGWRAMAVAFMVAGVTHFVMPASILAYLPTWVPGREAVAYGSGLIEIAGGAALFAGSLRRPVGLLLAMYLMAVLPANAYVAVTGTSVPGLPDVWWYHWLRLPLQGLFIWWTLWSTARVPAPDHQSRTGAIEVSA